VIRTVERVAPEVTLALPPASVEAPQPINRADLLPDQMIETSFSQNNIWPTDIWATDIVDRHLAKYIWPTDILLIDILDTDSFADRHMVGRHLSNRHLDTL